LANALVLPVVSGTNESPLSRETRTVPSRPRDHQRAVRKLRAAHERGVEALSTASRSAPRRSSGRSAALAEGDDGAVVGHEPAKSEPLYGDATADQVFPASGERRMAARLAQDHQLPVLRADERIQVLVVVDHLARVPAPSPSPVS